MTVLWQNWQRVVADPSSTLSEAPHDGHENATALGIHFLQAMRRRAGGFPNPDETALRIA